MKTYIVYTSHQFQDERAEHIHRVSMPDDKYRELKNEYGSSRWPFHRWVEKQLIKRIGERDWSLNTGTHWYVKSCKLER
jgi:hypothetical protein